jgi:hypothetical protein
LLRWRVYIDRSSIQAIRALKKSQLFHSLTHRIVDLCVCLAGTDGTNANAQLKVAAAATATNVVLMIEIEGLNTLAEI